MVTVLTPGTLARFEQEIRDSIGKPRYELWFEGHTRFTLQDDALSVGVPNRFYREWLENHFQGDIQRALTKVLGEPMPVRFRIDSALFQRAQNGSSTPNAKSAEHTIVEPTVRQDAPARVGKPPRPSRFSMSRFVIGNPNRVAQAAAASLVENPRDGYSPLLVHGGIGLGKTHLLKAIAEELRRAHPALKVEAMSCEEFTNQFVDGMKSGKLNSFRRKVRQLDVLVVEDVQFLANKRATQEEFLHTLNALESRGAKVVLSCDVHPRRLSKITEELRSRFLSGMVAKIDPPNREMRRQILRDKAAQRLLELPSDVIDYLSERLTSNISELEGALNYLEHYGDTLSAPLDLQTVQTAMVDILRHSAPVLRVGEIRKRACEMFNIHPKALKERSRSRSVAHPRMLVLFLARKFTQATYSEIGDQIGGLNHSTVIAAEKKIKAQIRKDGDIVLGDRPWKVRDAVEAFERELGRG